MPESTFSKKFKERKSDKVAFLAKGNGISLVKDLIQSLAETSKLKELEAVVFYSCKNEESIQFKEELELLAEENENLRVVYAMAGMTEEEKQKWQGETGFIDRKMVKRHLDNEQDFTFFVAGPPKFNDAMKKMLLEELCIKEEMIVLESFSGQ